MSFRTKKSLGQHWLHDKAIAAKIIQLFADNHEDGLVLEVGPGAGALTAKLYELYGAQLYLSEVDQRAIALAKEEHRIPDDHFVGDIIGKDLQLPDGQIGVLGNFPYNISNRIVITLCQHANQIPLIVGMFQKEVAERLAANHGNKTYGITSVFCQAFYDIDICFKVKPGSFSPPPKVDSAVIKLIRKEEIGNFDSELLLKVLKTAFGQRRKMLSNTLKPMPEILEKLSSEEKNLRAEQVAVERWIALAQ